MEQFFQLAAIGGTLGLLWLTLQAIRRLRGTGAQASRIRVQQRVSIANGCHLVVIEWDGKELLLATGSQTCTVVASKPVPALQVQSEVSGAWAH